MKRQVVHAENAPKAIGPYSQAIIANGFVFCSGQIAIDPAKGAMIEGDVAAQTAQALANVRELLHESDSGLEYVVKATVFLHKMSDFDAMNQIYSTFFADNPPARSTVGNLELPRGALVEIEVVALVKPS